MGKEKPRLRSLAEYSTFCATRSAPKDKRTVSLHRSRQQSPEQIKDKHFYSAEHNESLGPEMKLAAKSLFVFLSSVLLLFFFVFFTKSLTAKETFSATFIVIRNHYLRARRAARSGSKTHVTHLRRRGSDVIKHTCVAATEGRVHAGEMTQCADYTEAADKGSMFYLPC